MCRVANRKDIGHRAAAGEHLAKGVICIFCDDVALRVPVAHDIAVGVVPRHVELASGGVGSGGVGDGGIGRRLGRDLLHAPVEVVVAVGARPSVNQKFMTIVCHSCFFTC